MISLVAELSSIATDAPDPPAEGRGSRGKVAPAGSAGGSRRAALNPTALHRMLGTLRILMVPWTRSSTLMSGNIAALFFMRTFRARFRARSPYQRPPADVPPRHIRPHLFAQHDAALCSRSALQCRAIVSRHHPRLEPVREVALRLSARRPCCGLASEHVYDAQQHRAYASAKRLCFWIRGLWLGHTSLFVVDYK